MPGPGPVSPAPAGPAPWWTSRTTAGGYLGTDVGCASGTSPTALDAFFRDRMGPVIGHDYQHVHALGDGRHLWLFQDTFLDHTGNAERLDQSSFAHNTAMLQEGACFTLLHRGTAEAPTSFEPGTGERTLATWFWPLGGETRDGLLRVFWAEMAKTADPQPPDGLGWVPVRTWLATYDSATLARLDFSPAPNQGVSPIYGFAVSSDAEHTYLFGNTFDQNLARQGGYHSCPCSATAMSLARVPRGRLDAAPEYRTATGWTVDPHAAVPFLTRFHAENPMQPRFVGGHWVAVTKVDGYWADELAVDVAEQPWGPWTTVSRRALAPRGGDPLMNTYHAHLMPWLSDGSLVVAVSQNARDMLRDAWSHPERYRLQFLGAALVAPPRDPPETSSTTAPPTVAPTVPPTEPPPSTGPPATAPPSTDPPSTDPPPCVTTTTSTSSTSSSSTSTTTSSSTSTTAPCRQP